MIFLFCCRDKNILKKYVVAEVSILKSKPNAVALKSKYATTEQMRENFMTFFRHLRKSSVNNHFKCHIILGTKCRIWRSGTKSPKCVFRSLHTKFRKYFEAKHQNVVDSCSLVLTELYENWLESSGCKLVYYKLKIAFQEKKMWQGSVMLGRVIWNGWWCKY